MVLLSANWTEREPRGQFVCGLGALAVFARNLDGLRCILNLAVPGASKIGTAHAHE